jgi:aryl-alcohol dehydrogenase-like predicted oxidoreductase
VERRVTLGLTDLAPFGICLGGNVFGWTAGERESFAVLDAYRAAGGNFLDTSDAYGRGGPGSEGGDSETIIGRWMKARGCRDEMIVATKVGARDELMSLRPDVIRRAIEASLRRLQTDRADIYYLHLDDSETPLADSLAVLAEIVDSGRALHVGSCNYGAPRLREALAIAAREGFPRQVVVSYRYNLLERELYEAELRAVCAGAGIACLPYWGLARGFLTGKYRPGGPQVDSRRARHASAYLRDERSVPLLGALDAIAAAHATSVAAVALAWLRHQPTVASPVASARTPAQLAAILAAARLELSAGELEWLDDITAPQPVPKETSLT